MVAGAETRKSLASDTAVYSGGIEARSTDSTSLVALHSVLTEKKSSSTSAQVAFTAADSGSIESTSNLVDLGNSMHCFCDVGFSTSVAQASVGLALFCNPTTAGLIGLTEFWTFQANSLRRSTSGDYLSERYVFDVAGAAYAKPVVYSMTSASTVNVSIRPL